MTKSFASYFKLFAFGFLLLAGSHILAQAQTAEDIQREKAIAEYTQKMKDANYPALFDKAAQEFNVPPDVLKAVSFAETRWTQHVWPAGEEFSPENGMPHSYGIMALWDNNYFGHSLTDAARLIGQDPETLKTDVFQNMRGGAALLRQLYEQTPKPADAPNDEIESWRKAVAKYTGIPQPELSESHALRVYEYMNLGYHEYGFDWDAHPVNLGPMRAEVAAIRAAAHVAPLPLITNAPPTNTLAPVPVPVLEPQVIPPPIVAPPPFVPSPVPPDNSERDHQRMLILGFMVVLMCIAVWYLFFRKPKGTSEK